jgi:hypothetical protein
MEFVDVKTCPPVFIIRSQKTGAAIYGFVLMIRLHCIGIRWQKKNFIISSVSPPTKKYKGFAPTSYVLEDSKNRLWISFSRKGVVMLDKRTGETKQYVASDTASKTIVGNQVVDIKEDKDGLIWTTALMGSQELM